MIFMITFKVLSPQYVVWPASFLCVLRGPGSNTVRASYLAVCILTAVVFPLGFDRWITQNLWMVVCLNVRNALLVVCAIQLARQAVSTAGDQTLR